MGETQTCQAFTLKGQLLTLTVLQLHQADLSAIREQLASTVEKTPNFFRNMPIVIDCQKIADNPTPVPFGELSHLLREFGLLPVGVSNTNQQQEKAAAEASLGTIGQIKKEPKKEKKAEIKPAAAKIISGPVRSGQQVYAKESHLIITASVSEGAEILADGHIHVYGTLRGRALAGVTGDTNARIFCHGLQAELISIAGRYKMKDQIQIDDNGPYHIYMEDDQLQVVGLG